MLSKCGAKTRNGTPCKQNAMSNGRCRMHGGMSKGPSKGSQNALKHGFFARIFPNDPDTQAIIESITIKSPIDILWENIVIQYVAIVRAQRLMFVRDQEDHSDFTVKEGLTQIGEVLEKERQWAWDKHANFLQAQSRAMTALESLIARYESMLPDGVKMEKQRLELEKIKVEIDRVKNGGNSEEAEEWISALEEVAERRRKAREKDE